MNTELGPDTGTRDLATLFAQIESLKHDVIEKALREHNLWGDWAKLKAHVSTVLGEGSPALNHALMLLPNRNGEELRKFNRDTVSRNLTRKTNPRSGDLQLVAVQLAAALYGDDFARWPDVIGGPKQRAVPAPARPVRLAVFRARDIAYTQDIYIGFVTRLAQVLGGADRVHLVADRVAHTDTPDAEDDWERPEEVSAPLVSGFAADARGVVARARDHAADYLVAIGTQAAEALKGALGDDYGNANGCPFVFLGVTYPDKCHLVNDLERETPDTLNVSGVGYGRGLNGIATWIRRHWPDDPIRFVYRVGTNQDQQAADALSQLKLGDFQVLKYDRFPTAADLDAHRDAILFSWHTFERMYEEQALRERLRNRRVVATTRRNVENGHALVGYSVDDFDIGALGAHLIAAHAKEGGSLGKRRIEQPNFRVWVNRAELAAREDQWIPRSVLDEVPVVS